MKQKSIQLTIILAVVALIFSCQGRSDHPRILLPEGQEELIKKQIETNETWAKIHQAIIAQSENILESEPRERIKIGRRLLRTSQEYLRRVFYLSYAYRMTGNERYLQHAEKEMLKAAGFSDWNPTHFLDVAEMTMALAIGYDWLYEGLSKESQEIIKDAIVNKGLKPSFNKKYNGFLRKENNWNQVCNAGMTFGAMAIMEDYPELADSVIDRAFKSIPRAMKGYQPDGAYPEGYNYWGYGTTFNVMFLSAVETYYGTDRGLTDADGFLKTAGFLENMLAPSGVCFNWGDGDRMGSLLPAMFWLADRNDDPTLLWMENKYLQIEDYSKFTIDRLLPAIMIWGKNIAFEDIKEPVSKVWMSKGVNPVCLMRTSWSDPNALFVGYKAGSPSVNHGHMDVGSFILEADGVRWASDFGEQDYESLESKGMSIFGKDQDAERWKVFRLNNYSHSTLTIDGELQRVDGYAKIDKHSDAENFMNAVSDISTVYKNQLKKAIRGVGIKDNSFVIVRDEIETSDKPAKIRWNMLTETSVKLTEGGATLTKDGKTLYMRVLGSGNIQMKTWSTAPTNNYDAENPGTIMVGFECELPANSKETFEVLLVPEKANEVDFLNLKLDEW